MKPKQSPKSDPHLGGHSFKTHIDSGILNFFRDTLDCKTMLDVGCGPGGMVYEANKRGYNAIGIDGDYRLERDNPEYFVLHDFTKGPCNLTDTYDLGYSCEFVEHVEEDYVPNFMESFAKCKYVTITYAPPGTKGWHHVNCNTKEYWIDVFKKYNLIFDQELTNEMQKVSSMKRDFFRKHGLCFKNEN